MTEKVSFAHRLREGLALRNLQQKDLSDRTGIPKSALSQYCGGSFVPKQNRTALIAEALDVNEAWLMGYDVPMERQQPASTSESIIPPGFSPMPEMKKVPRLGRIACGEPILAEENIEDYDDVPAYVKADFTLVCKGDSMINARIYDGDIVCIRKQENVENGEIAAVLVDGDTATLKRVRLFPDHIVLEPENPTYRPLTFWEEDMNKVHIIGKATHFISAVK